VKPNSPRYIFRTETDEWHRNPQIGGKKDLGVLLLKRAMQQKSVSLNLSGMSLQVLPSSIRFLARLKTLDLNGNRLQTLPVQISSLPSLSHLWISNNALTSLPAEIGLLNALTVLDLGHNSLSVFPMEICSLFNLRILNLRNNQINLIPSSIGALKNLEKLTLSNNPLTSLPIALGETAVASLQTVGTFIPDDQVKALLQLVLSKKNSLNALKSTLDLWQSYSKSEHNLSYASTVINEKMFVICEWLGKLAATEEFQEHQQELANLACSMLESLNDCEEFRTYFFDQVSVNTVHCGDRASMAFNELYTHWRVMTLPPATPLRIKLKLLKAFAITCALRKVVQRHLKTNQANEVENSEVFLFCEKELKDRLGLLIAIKTMAHENIGRREFLNFDVLEKETLSTYGAILVETDMIRALIAEDSEFAARVSKKEIEVWDRLDRLFDSYHAADNVMSEHRYIAKTNAIMRSRRRMIMRWVDRNIE
jgi:hypothetical protein